MTNIENVEVNWKILGIKAWFNGMCAIMAEQVLLENSKATRRARNMAVSCSKIKVEYHILIAVRD